MKNSSIRIFDAKSSRKNPNAKYIVKSVGKNGELLQSSEALNDVKAVKTNINAMCKVWWTELNTIQSSGRFRQQIQDHTKEQKFAKSGFAIEAPQPKTKKS